MAHMLQRRTRRSCGLCWLRALYRIINHSQAFLVVDTEEFPKYCSANLRPTDYGSNNCNEFVSTSVDILEEIARISEPLRSISRNYDVGLLQRDVFQAFRFPFHLHQQYPANYRDSII